MYVERGGRTLLTWSDDPDRLGPAAASLAEAARRGSLGRITVEKADGEQLLGSGSTPAARGAAGGRLRRHAQGPAAEVGRCLRVTPYCRTARRLARALDGRTLTRTDFRVPQHATADLAGATVLGTVSRGKHLLTRLDAPDGRITLHTHLKMEGSWRSSSPAAGGTRARTRSGWCSRRRGRPRSASCSASSSCCRPTVRRRPSATSAPTCSAPDWDEAEALRRLREHADEPVFEALLDQTLLAGIGTIYAAEVLFVMGVPPATPVGDVPDLPRLVRRVRQMLDRESVTGRTAMWVYRAAAVPPLRHAGARRPVRAGRPGALGVLVPRCQSGRLIRQPT